MKLIVAGSRLYADYERISKVLDDFCASNNVTEIVSGAADGVDSLAIRYARERKISCKQFPVTRAEWRASSRAGFDRNERMAEYADYLIAFTLGTPGTAHMIKEMKRLGKPLLVIDVREKENQRSLRDF